MTVKETLERLEALGSAKVRTQNAKGGAGDNQFGVSLGDIRAVAKRIRTDHALALSLWETQNVIAFIPYRVPRERNGQVTLEERFWSATHTPILDEDGNVQLILQHTVDVTDLARAQEDVADRRDELGVLQRARRVQEANDSLDAERQHLRRLFEQAPGFVAVLVGPEHVFELVNAAYRQLIDHREIVGKPVREALPEVADQGFFQILDQVFTTGQPFVGRGVAIRLERHPGAALDEVFVDFVYQPIVDAADKVPGSSCRGMTSPRRSNSRWNARPCSEAALDGYHDTGRPLRTNVTWIWGVGDPLFSGEEPRQEGGRGGRSRPTWPRRCC